jgi:DNA-binding SARP family transcriptional activator
MLRIWLFGSLSAAVGPCVGSAERGHAAAPVSGRSGSLLAYLALRRGRFFSRSDLLQILWPEHTASMSSGSFNTALWRLRRLVECPPHQHGELINSDRRGAIGLCAGSSVWLDVEEFESRITAGLSKPIEQLDDAEIDDLRRGADLYKADILAEFSDDWALREREKHRRHYLNALWRLMQLATIRRDYAQGILHAQSILDFDVLREDVHRELMKLFVLSGQRAQALRQFEHCRGMLRRELAIQPMRETLQLYQQIADSAIGRSPDGGVLALHEPGAPPSLRPAPSPGSRLEPAEPSAPQRMIALARQHLAFADAQLELGLEQLEP